MTVNHYLVKLQQTAILCNDSESLSHANTVSCISILPCSSQLSCKKKNYLAHNVVGNQHPEMPQYSLRTSDLRCLDAT